MDDPRLRDGWRTSPHPDRFGQHHPDYASAMAAHDAAVNARADGYVDPSTGLIVMTAPALAARPCCEQGCRHCPWEPV